MSYAYEFIFIERKRKRKHIFIDFLHFHLIFFLFFCFSFSHFPLLFSFFIIYFYNSITEFIWSQEEHRNMGAWTFIKLRFENMCGRKIKYRGRAEGATVAVGVSTWHKNEADILIHDTFKGI